VGAGAMRPVVVDALNRGSSLMSYVGHGSVAIWASVSSMRPAASS